MAQHNLKAPDCIGPTGNSEELHLFYPPLEGGSNCEAIRGGDLVAGPLPEICSLRSQISTLPQGEGGCKIWAIGATAIGGEMAKIVLAETISQCAEGQAVRSKIFDNGMGEFAVVKLRLDPLPGANTVLFSSALIFPISQEYLSGIADGIDEAAHAGVLNEGRVLNVQVTLLDARYHELNSSRRSFRLAAIAAFQDAMRNAGPVLVSPAGN